MERTVNLAAGLKARGVPTFFWLCLLTPTLIPPYREENTETVVIKSEWIVANRHRRLDWAVFYVPADTVLVIMETESAPIARRYWVWLRYTVTVL